METENNTIATALDFETTGVCSGFPDEPWQIGCAEIFFKDGEFRINDVCGALLRISPSRPFNKFAPGRHAKLREVLAISPSFDEIWRDFRHRLLGKFIVAHNIRTERTILRKLAPMHAFGPWIDTLKISRLVWRGLPSYALEDLIPLLGLERETRKLCPKLGPHDAVYDAAACSVLLRHVMRQPGWCNLSFECLAELS